MEARFGESNRQIGALQGAGPAISKRVQQQQSELEELARKIESLEDQAILGGRGDAPDTGAGASGGGAADPNAKAMKR